MSECSENFLSFCSDGRNSGARGAAACGDDVEIVQPTPEPPPPPPPVTATMAPASASVAVGNSVVFAVNASGGVAGEAASWTCASSNTGIATVTSTSAGCSATGVAAGDVTITASVTKSGETVNVGAQLTVTSDEEPPAPPGDPAFVLVAGIASSDGRRLMPAGLKKRVTCRRWASSAATRISRSCRFLVDGEVVESQSFGGGMDMGMGMTPEPEDAEAAAEQAPCITSPSRSTRHDHDDGPLAHPVYMNGEHTISAELEIGVTMADGMHGHETISSNVQTVTFNNEDGYVVTADLGHNSALDDSGRRWYGGPDNGHIVISALPVIYSGEETGAVTVGLGDCDAEDGDDPLSVEFDCEDVEGTQTITVSSGGENRKILNEDDLPKANIDMVGPSESPIIIANRNGRENGWINAAVGISGTFHASRGKDNWLVMGADTTNGVGGYNMMVRIGDDLEEALEATPSASLPAESDDAEAYCAIASATDDLGNESELPDDDDDCRAAPPGADVELKYVRDGATDSVTVYGYDDNGDNDDAAIAADDVSESDQTLEFGVDTTAPSLDFGDDYDDDNRHATVPSAFSFDHFDDESDVGNSGIDANDGLMVSLQRRNTSKTECITIADDGAVAADAAVDRDCDSTSISDTDVTLADGVGVAYYTLSGTAQDQAGNRSTTISHTFVYDGGTGAAARATAPAIPGAIEAGEPFSGASFLNDNLSIRDYYGTADFADVVSIGIGAPVVVDEFNAASLTYQNHTVSATVDTYAAVQDDDARATIQPIDGVTVAVRDQAQAAYTTEDTDIPARDVTDVPDAGDAFAAGAFTYDFVYPGTATAYASVCGHAKCEEENLSASLTIRVRATAPTAGVSFRDPFESVDFLVTDVNGVSWKIAADASGTSGRTDDGERTWTYSATVPGTMLRAATRPGTGTGTAAIVAIAVNDNDVGLVKSTTIPTFGTKDDD